MMLLLLHEKYSDIVFLLCIKTAVAVFVRRPQRYQLNSTFYFNNIIFFTDVKEPDSSLYT